jgi:hypothetical protein
MQDGEVASGLDVVDYVVEARRQNGDVFPVERRDEACIRRPMISCVV